MEPILTSQIIEQFHLLFLALLTRGTDKRSLVVRGGCNLRFFHRSIRYSEDMALDVDGIELRVLRDRVRARRRLARSGRTWNPGASRSST